MMCHVRGQHVVLCDHGVRDHYWASADLDRAAVPDYRCERCSNRRCSHSPGQEAARARLAGALPGRHNAWHQFIYDDAPVLSGDHDYPDDCELAK